MDRNLCHNMLRSFGVIHKVFLPHYPIQVQILKFSITEDMVDIKHQLRSVHMAAEKYLAGQHG